MDCEYCGGRIKKLGVRFCRSCIRKGPAAERRAAIAVPAAPEGMAWIPTSTGTFALVDAEREAEVLRFFWTVSKKSGYAYTQIGGKIVGLHQMILPGCKQVDHKNGNRLDCRRDNLRPATQRQNLGNASRKRNSKAPYKGITWAKDKQKWKAQIRTGGGLNPHLGYFDTPEDAARAYDEKAREVFGEFACVNFPREGERGALEPVQ